MMSVRNGKIDCTVHGSVGEVPADGDALWAAMKDHLLADADSHGLCGDGPIKDATCPMPWVCDICPAARTWLENIGT